jgi:pyruvate/2-oxoglutarate dehydrogenase complex dihydrolipoamide dehydrogenase (E3) component
MVASRAATFFEQDYDLVVIGAGPAGRAAALAARGQNARVLVVEPDLAGHRSEFVTRARAHAFVAAAGAGSSYHDAIAEASRLGQTVSDRYRADELRHDGIDVLGCTARFVGPGEIAVDDAVVRCGRFIVATGARRAVPDIPGLAASSPITAEHLDALTEPPRSLAVLGAGSEACELAQAFARLGVEVLLLTDAERILPDDDPEASAIITHTLRTDGVDVRAGSNVARAERDEATGRVQLVIKNGETVSATHLLVAAEREAVTEELDLGAAGVITDANGFIGVDEHLRTNVPGAYAAGDVTGLVFDIDAAEQMGRLAAGHALTRGARGEFDPGLVPRVTFTSPEVARVGVPEAEAGRFARVAYLPLNETDRGALERVADGYVKLVAAPSLSSVRLLGGRVVGASVVSPQAGEVIGELTLAVQLGLSPARLANTAHGYPTWSAALSRCAAQFLHPIHGRRPRGARR